MGKMRRTRKEWAHAFGVDYQMMVTALKIFPNRRGVKGCLFDVDEARDALVKHLGDRRMVYLNQARQIDEQIDGIRKKVFE